MTSPGRSMASRRRTSTLGRPVNRWRSATEASRAKIMASASRITWGSTNTAPAAPCISTSISWPLSRAACSSASAAIALCAMPVGQAVTPTNFIRSSLSPLLDLSITCVVRSRLPRYLDLLAHEVHDFFGCLGGPERGPEPLVHEPPGELREDRDVQVVLALGGGDEEHEVGHLVAELDRLAGAAEGDAGGPDPAALGVRDGDAHLHRGAPGLLLARPDGLHVGVLVGEASVRLDQAGQNVYGAPAVGGVHVQRNQVRVRDVVNGRAHPD